MPFASSNIDPSQYWFCLEKLRADVASANDSNRKGIEEELIELEGLVPEIKYKVR